MSVLSELLDPDNPGERAYYLALVALGLVAICLGYDLTGVR